MRPPRTINVVDRHGGFTCESKMPYFLKASGVRHGRPRGSRFNMKWRRDAVAGGKLPIGDTLWRPGAVLRHGTTGTLVDYNESSFWQTNDDVTIAVYRVSGYGYPVLVWFDNKTGERIA